MSNIVTVNFRNDTLYGVERDDGVYVALKPIVEAMGLSWGSQYNRVKRDPILDEAIFMMKTPFQSHGQEEVCLKLEMVNGWLFTIDDSRIKDEDVREKVLTYKRECYDVLYKHFHGKTQAGLKSVEIIEDDLREAESHAIRKVMETRQIFGHQAAGQLWMLLGLPTVPAMYMDQSQYEMFVGKPLHIASQTQAA